MHWHLFLWIGRWRVAQIAQTEFPAEVNCLATSHGQAEACTRKKLLETDSFTSLELLKVKANAVSREIME